MTKESGLPSDVDVLLVTVTEVEGRTVLEEVESQVPQDLPQGGTSPKPIHIRNNTYFDLGSIEGARILMVQSEMGAGGPGGSTLTVYDAVRDLSPSVVIMLGIAFGVDEQKQNIGDILVSRQLQLYELQRIGTGAAGESKIILRDDKPLASPSLLQRFRASCLQWKSETKVRFGLVLSGAKLVDNQDYREQLCSFAPEAIGGEMEGGGIYSAAYRKGVDWIVVKAIADWADGKKRENKAERQQEAAKNATRFVFHTLRQGGFINKPLPDPDPLGIGKKTNYSGKEKIAICKRLGDSWEDLADCLEIPTSDRRKFKKGEEARGIWAWLEERNKLQELREALTYKYLGKINCIFCSKIF